MAGGISAEDTPIETIVREADEEASMTRRDVRSAGVLIYMTLLEKRLGNVGGGDLVKPDMGARVRVMELAEDVAPKPYADEMRDFYLWTPDEVKAALLRDECKTKSAAVMVDFFIRHGIVTADNELHYAEMSMRLHRMLPFATAPRL